MNSFTPKRIYYQVWRSQCVVLTRTNVTERLTCLQRKCMISYRAENMMSINNEKMRESEKLATIRLHKK